MKNITYSGWIVVALLVCTGVGNSQIPNGLSIKGDFRLRYEINAVEGSTNLKDRQRIRLRWAFKYQSDAIEIGSRLATNASDKQSPHQTLGVLDASDNIKFGLDRAYLKMHLGKRSIFTVGKTGLNYWQQNEIFFDNDLSPEGISASHSMPLGISKVTINAGYYVLNEEDAAVGVFQDDNLSILQAVYNVKPKSNKLKSTTSVGFGSLSDVGDSSDVYENRQVITVAQQIADVFPFPLDIGIDYMLSNADSGNTALILMLKSRFKSLGFGLWYYDVGANSTPYSGFSQDNWPNSVGFKGLRLQVNFKLMSGVNADFRIYQEIENYLKNKTVRYQLNLNSKF